MQRKILTPTRRRPVALTATRGAALVVLRAALATVLFTVPLLRAQTVILPASSAAQQPGLAAPITLDEAIRRAQTSDVAYRVAVTNNTVAGLDRSIARSALLPGVVYHNQYIYTKPGQQANAGSPIFISNNGVREYISQGFAFETVSIGGVANYRRLSAEAAATTARTEVARRGLVATVIGNYFGVLAAEKKLQVAQRSADEAGRFSNLTQKLEAGREVAHADVVKASLQLQQRQRDLADAALQAERTRLDLGVLLFSDPRTPYTLASDLQQPRALPEKAVVQSEGMKNNPDLRAALQSSRAAQFDLLSARAAYLPELSVAYFYGIDAAQFALTAPDGSRNLGYAVAATLDIPVWNWFATHSRVKQSVARRDLARVELTVTQRQLIASLEELYNEARVASAQFASFETTVQTAAESLRLTNLRYTAGEATVLEVVDAQNSLSAAQASQVDAIVRYHVAFGQLQTLTGKLP